ncbi:hypothetical protein CDV31_006609 [Fusarium ambrosium]|uniref:Fungal N-terminal domain-containing protein n=1 Tax=Fusarium ambrosium TaxID=131363 RepID=A0A428UC40_9HYPO|nr:hypothetical protein CDV31_006609 [Fusarium ambrosium]
MNPISVFSAAGGAMRLFNYSFNIIKAALKLIESPEGVPADLHDIETAVNDLAESIKQLSVDAHQERDKFLVAICASSCDMAQGFLTVIRVFQQSVMGSERETVSKALREAGCQQSIEALQARLSRLQLLLRDRIEMETPERKHDVQVALASMAARVVRVSVQDKVGYNGVNAKGVTSIADKINANDAVLDTGNKSIKTIS